MKMKFAVITVVAAAVCFGGCSDDNKSKGDAGPDGGEGLISLMAGEHALTENAVLAISMAPDWLRPDMRANLTTLEDDLQDALSALMMDLEDPRMLDEVAFCIGHISPTQLDPPEDSTLDEFYPELILDNVESLFLIDEEVAYADIVDYGDPSSDEDYYSTIEYSIQIDGVDEVLEMDREYYYWYIVFPVIEDEPATYINPANGSVADPPNGRFWRDYLFWEADDTYTPLADYLAGQEYVWKGKSNAEYGSDEAKDDNGAIGNIIHWVLDSLDFTSDSERPVQPVRIYAKHYGRCGEHSDLSSAAARSALIPSINLAAWANDHVWNEFWDQRWVQWEPVNTYVEHYSYYADADGNYHRSGLGIDNDCDGEVDEGCDLADPTTDADTDGYTVADGDCNDHDDTIYPGATEIAGDFKDNDCDGEADDGTDTTDNDDDGYTIAEGDCNDASGSIYPGADEVTPSTNRNFAVSAWRGDGKVWTVTDRYAGEFTLDVNVTDANDDPVDGATVSIWGYSTTYPSNPGISIATWGITDLDGRASFLLGEANKYYFRVESAIGNLPATDTITVDALFDDPVKGETRTFDVKLTSAIPAVTANELGYSESGEWGIELAWDMTGFFGGINLFIETLMRDPADGLLNMYFVDEANKAAFESGGAFDAIGVWEFVYEPGGATVAVDPTLGPYYLIATPASLSGIVDLDITGSILQNGVEVASEQFIVPVVHDDFAAVKFEIIP